jgi:hypothetical protein
MLSWREQTPFFERRCAPSWIDHCNPAHGGTLKIASNEEETRFFFESAAPLALNQLTRGTVASLVMAEIEFPLFRTMLVN